MGYFTIKRFTKICIAVMANTLDRLLAARNNPKQSLKKNKSKHVVRTSGAVIPRGAEISQPEAFWEIHQTLLKTHN